MNTFFGVQIRNRALCLVLIFIFFNSTLWAQIKLCSWNMRDMGSSKNADELDFIARTIKDMDVIAVQEVVAGAGGAQAIAQLADILNRKGNSWDYTVSDHTSGEGPSVERYAFIWKKARVKLKNKAMLDKNFSNEIEREPYMATFVNNKKEFTVVTIHARPKSKNPEAEIKYLKYFPEKYQGVMIFCGDFNLPQSHTVFNPLKSLGYANALSNQKTSLKQQEKNGAFLASEYDNFFYPQSHVKLISSGVIHFYKSFSSLKEARKISDHIPVFMEFELK